MGSYKLFLFRDGELSGSLVRECAEDQDALEIAYTVSRDHAVEIFDGERLVARLKQGSEHETVDAPQSIAKQRGSPSAA